MKLGRDLEDALMAFDPRVPVFLAVPRPSYSNLCKLRRRGLAVCEYYNGGYRGIYGYRWRMTPDGERARAAIVKARGQ